jgi:radical SAM superfamily enzyme YgiQ (UPF0313 family)
MRVLFVYPKPDLAPFYLQTPIGILYLAAALEGRHEVRIYDANVDDNELDAVVSEFAPDVIGVSFSTGCVKTSFHIAERFGGNGCIMMAGGIHPTYRPKECIEAGFDIVARGEIEDTLPAVLDNISSSPPFIRGSTLPPGYSLKIHMGIMWIPVSPAALMWTDLFQRVTYCLKNTTKVILMEF